MSKNKIVTLQDAANALSFCDPNGDFGYWMKLGTALAGEFGDQAFDIFDTWSSAGSTYNAKSTKNYWKGWLRNNNPNRPNLSSLAYEAKLGGWVPDRHTTLSPEEVARRDKELAERAVRKESEQAIAQREAEQNIKQSHADFFAMPNDLPPTEYMLKKYMTDIVEHLDIRFFTKPGFLGRMFCWPLWDDDPRVNPQAQWCGYEKICDRKNEKKQGKFLSRSGKNDRGFGVIGKPLNQVKRVFICGGLADGFSGHIATGETMVVVVGESNIPNIKRRLQELYPELIVVVSPDNDKAGIAQVEKAGGFWSLPEKAGADWSDVYINEGAEEVKRQLLNIRGLAYNVVNQRHLDIKIQPGLNLIKSGKETGKSYSTSAWSRNNRQLKTLVISYRRNLLQALAKSFDAQYYEDLILGESSNDTDRNMLLRQAMRLVITPDSLWRLQGSEWDAVVVDECDQTLMHFLSETMLKSGRQILNVEMFAHLLSRASTQVMMDADLSDLTVGFCNYIGLQSGTYHINEHKPRQGSTLFVYESPHHMLAKLKDKLLTGERHYYCANSKNQIINFDEKLRIAKRRGHWNGEWFSVCSDNSTDDQTGEIVRDIDNRVGEWNALLASPSWGTGISINEGHPFQATWGRFGSNTGTVEQAHQQLARARGITEYHVYVDPTERAEPTDPDQILRLDLAEPDAETAKFLKLEDGQLAFTSNLFEWVYCHVKAAVNKSKNNFKGLFLAQAEAEGYSIVHVMKNKMMVTFGKQDAEEASERLRRLDMLSMVDANLLDDDQLRQAMHGDADQTQAAIIKSRVYQELNLDAMQPEHVDQLVWDAASVFQSVTATETEFGDDVINVWPAGRRELIINALGFGQQQERLVSRIKKLAIAAMPAELVKALDLKDRKFAQSRAHLHHYAKRRHHLLCILAAVGIDEQLNYDGRTWNAMQITKDLRGWMTRNREALYKYSGVSLTDNAIDEPLQWLHGFLRGLAIDVVCHGQKRVKGQRVHVYGIDGDSLSSVRILTGLRISGIQSAMMDDGQVSHPAQLVNSNQLAQGVTPSIRVEAAPHLTLKTSEDVPTCKESAAESTEILYFADSIPEGSFERVAAYLQEVMREGRAKKLGRRDQMTLIHVAPWLNKQEVISALAEGSAVPLLRHIKEAAKSGVECGADRLSAAVLFDLLQSDISPDDLAEFLSGAAVQPLGEMA
ncbi:plasmid replication protein, CyRepA1 family [Aeromonas jandaei]|uniref:plasmid replication protein, CyRepA1 family n=1 Tax=Aeromonas jandaei TaxID=650 RepID=UPI002B05708A|nr:plasmid replication protein, CyRepA1 family [Aeromonas jandaei]